MSEEVPTGLLVVEKLFGVIFIIIGAFFTYLPATGSPTGDAGVFSSIFIVVGIVILGVGILLLIAKNE